MQKIYYDSLTNKEIVDVRGTSDIQSICKKFNLDKANVQELTLSGADSAYQIIDGKLKEKEKEEKPPVKDVVSLNEALEIITELKKASSFEDFKSKTTSEIKGN